MKAELAICGSNLCGDVPFSCAVRRGASIVEARSPVGGRGELAALVADLCARESVPSAAIDGLFVDLGPGSYTGLRVAVTFVRFLQHYGSVSVRAVDSLALMAARVPARAAGVVHAVLDARRGRYHHGVFRQGQDGVLVVERPAAAVALTDLSTTIEPGDVVVLPETLVLPTDHEWAARGAGICRVAAITARELFSAALPSRLALSAELEPRYLMASYAEG